MSGRIPSRVAKLLTALVAAMAVIAVTAGAAGAATIYNNSATPKQKNLASIGFEATSTSQFGGLVEFASTQRTSPVVTVTMSSWACGNLLGGASCATAPKATFSWPITLNIYALGVGNEPGPLIGTTTQTINVPYRPSANNRHCPLNSENDVGYGSECWHGIAFKAKFSLPGVVLPSKAIVAVAYNTTDYGAEPTHAPSVGEDSLNLAVTEPPEAPTVGSDPLPEDAFIASTYYPGEAGPGVFSIQPGWEGYQPVFQIRAMPH